MSISVRNLVVNSWPAAGACAINPLLFRLVCGVCLQYASAGGPGSVCGPDLTDTHDKGHYSFQPAGPTGCRVFCAQLSYNGGCSYDYFTHIKRLIVGVLPSVVNLSKQRLKRISRRIEICRWEHTSSAQEMLIFPINQVGALHYLALWYRILLSNSMGWLLAVWPSVVSEKINSSFLSYHFRTNIDLMLTSH